MEIIYYSIQSILLFCIYSEILQYTLICSYCYENCNKLYI